jgi:hypothetical protein
MKKQNEKKDGCAVAHTQQPTTHNREQQAAAAEEKKKKKKEEDEEDDNYIPYTRTLVRILVYIEISARTEKKPIMRYFRILIYQKYN